MGIRESIVYQSPDELKSRITEAIQTVDPAMLHWTRLEILHKLDQFRATDGARIEFMD